MVKAGLIIPMLQTRGLGLSAAVFLHILLCLPSFFPFLNIFILFFSLEKDLLSECIFIIKIFGKHSKAQTKIRHPLP